MRARIFLVDDYAEILRSTERLLRRAGHEVFTFSRPSLCERCRCEEGHACTDIVISDVRMPEHTGLEFIENQRQKGCRAPYLALASGAWSKADFARAKELDCQIFQKPFDIDALLDWVEECSAQIDPERVLDSWFLENVEAKS